MHEKWVLAEPVEVPTELREAVGGHALVARLLAQRGLGDPERAQRFLDPARYTPASPYDLPGMAAAAQLLRASIAKGERVRIWGDFDADGQTSTAVLYEALAALEARVDYRLPKRSESHGMNERTLREALADGVGLLITCDNGIGDGALITQGVAAGLTVVITDHHDLPPTLPPAQAIVNPNMLPDDHPLYELAGVGVAYMVARALLEGTAQAPLLAEMLDLVALGLVADLSNLVGDVRYLTQLGLEVLRHTLRPGLAALIRAAELDQPHLGEEQISFQLGPRLNAAGRLADSELALRLLLTRDVVEAEKLAGELEALNRERQGHAEAVTSAAEEAIRRQPELAHEPALVLDSATWKDGVLGSVASDLARRYDRPVILIAHREGDASIASARSVEGVDIHQAIAAQKALLLREGGHPMAAGFAISRENVPAFRRALLEWLAREAPKREVRPVAVDAAVPWEEVDLDLARQVARLSPFGNGNPRPILLTGPGILTRVEDVSRTRATPHRRLFLDDDAARGLRAVWFNAGELPPVGERLDIAFFIGVSAWRGQERLQLELVDWRPAAREAEVELARLVSGREVLDWRARDDAEALLADLRARYGANLAVWGEGSAAARLAASSRYQLKGRRAAALVILTAPPAPQDLRWVLAEVQPQVLYLFPPQGVAEPTAAELIADVAGMLKVALREHGGEVDALRMAARIGAQVAAVVAALRGLEAAGVIMLRYEDHGVLRALRPEEAPAEVQNGTPQTPQERTAQQVRAQEQAREALVALLRETRAYRQAWEEDAVPALLYGTAS